MPSERRQSLRTAWVVRGQHDWYASNMKCMHCQTSVHYQAESFPIGTDDDGVWTILAGSCPSCTKLIVHLDCQRTIVERGLRSARGHLYPVRPPSGHRPAPPADVPPELAEDYNEASAVLHLSPKASAALSRRCLQHLLRDTAQVKHQDLAREIDEVLARPGFPSHLAEAIDAIRQLGNFAVHPVKSTHSGEVLPVEAGEAEWTLDVLDLLFDFYFVQPALQKKKREALNEKLREAGKPQLKGGT